MSAKLKKDAIDLGIVTRNPEAMLTFYRDTLGFNFKEETPMSGGGNMLRLMCGSSMIKLVTPGNLADVDAPPGGIGGATGYRYFTITVSNLDEVTQECADSGASVAVPVTEIRSGVRIAIVNDPDGNWVEFVQYAN
ncbi:MAG: extradiol dioxygenase [Deltaproteobacteria bacterium]|jgi:catechol 2,3-dioxygenase-like lactoylglutathione lyase family enzyme|nr:extradiol dioxygenase [Deltaproteobacteria bacterium]MBQ32410.1 extradiol dioxygenase [Deltaproteobacteria bacterium]MDP7158760.1 VOC family protein [SAR324 cluster bacterium]MDP7629141.1 VOC family protein [SAR324 cluster bacterium]